ncbi:Cyclin-G2 [Schistosoma japonicum]|nr:Cyclin-G2 [Schistosoma japonicum]KAH8877442.1 Cyclin-G2 [Schistosoma japonicum]
MAKVFTQHQQPFSSQTTHSSNSSYVASFYTTRSRFNLLRAPKRTISQNRRYPSRMRRAQKCDSNSMSFGNDPQKPNAINIISDVADSKQAAHRILANQCSPHIPFDYKRPRPELTDHSSGKLIDVPTSTPPVCYLRHVQPKSSLRFDFSKICYTHMVCKLSLLDNDRLQDLLSKEFTYQPNNAFLYYVNPEVDDKVDAVLRNDAVHNLRFMHNSFFNLSTETFCKAVNLIDRFIVKVKVKPKYMACVATASYCAICKLSSSNNKNNALLPDPETVVHITRCGGNAADLLRMEEILASKLSHDLDGVNAFDFLKLFIDCVAKSKDIIDDESVNPEPTTMSSFLLESDVENSSEEKVTEAINLTSSVQKSDGVKKNPVTIHQNDFSLKTLVYRRLGTLMEIALCSLEVYRFRPVCLALGILAQAGIEGLLPLADLCGVDWFDVCDCSNLVGQLYELYYRDPLPSSRRRTGLLVTRRQFRVGYSSPTPLDTISEDYEPVEDDEWLLPLLFEP